MVSKAPTGIKLEWVVVIKVGGNIIPVQKLQSGLKRLPHTLHASTANPTKVSPIISKFEATLLIKYLPAVCPTTLENKTKRC